MQNFLFYSLLLTSNCVDGFEEGCIYCHIFLVEEIFLVVMYVDVGKRRRYANKIMVSDELPDGQMIDQWEPVGPNSIQTPFEVSARLILWLP